MYYVKEFSPEETNSEYFFDFVGEGLTIIGGDRCRDYGDVDGWKKIIDNISEWRYYAKTLTEAVNDILPAKANGKKYGGKDISRLRDLIDSYAEHYSIDGEDIAELLSIVNGKEYTACGIYGCCQGDYAEVIMPKSEYSREYIDEIECYYFNLGTEVMIHDGDNEPETAGEIDGYCEYIPMIGYSEDIKAKLAEWLGCDENEITYYAFVGYTQTAEHKIV